MNQELFFNPEKLASTYKPSPHIFALFVFFSACTSSPPAAEPTRPLAVRTTQLRTGPIRETLRYVGTVHSQNEINVLARLAGKMEEFPVAEGESAMEGAVLARIAAPETGARVSRLRADVSRVREESVFLCQQAEIDKELARSDTIPRVRADGSRQKCTSSRAALKAARAGLRELKVLAGNTVELAPFDGKVLKWLAEPGENVMPGRPILILGDEPLEVRVQVHEKDVSAGIEKGTIAILSPEHSPPLRSEVSFAAPMATGLSRMFEIRIPLKEEDAALFRHGMSVDVAFVLNEKQEAVMVPVDAVKKADPGMGIFVVRDDVARWENVAPSIREKGWIAIEANLKGDDRVVVSNLDMLRDGMAVYPVSSEGNAP